MFNISIYTIRFYDKEGLMPFVLRNKAGNRVFTESDVSLFRTICCLKNTGMQIKDIKKYIDLCMEGAGTIDLREKLLLKHKEVIINQINALNKNLDHICTKIEKYHNILMLSKLLVKKEKWFMRRNVRITYYNNKIKEILRFAICRKDELVF